MKNNFITVYYDAWKNDDHENPLESLLYNIAKNFGKGKSVVHKGWSEKIINLIECVSLPQLGSIKAVKNAISGVDILEEFKKKEQLKELLKKALDELFSEDKKRMIVFIDELDRCRPTYAIKLLEKIKHLFDDPRIVFVFSTNLGQLENTVKKYYGENFAAYEYLDKIFDLRLGLNKIEVEDYIKFLLLENELFNDYDITDIAEIVQHFNFGLRGCERYVMQLKILKKYLVQVGKSRFSKYSGNSRILFFIPILLALKLKDIDSYNNFIQGESSDEFKVFLESNVNIKKKLNWIFRGAAEINENNIDDFYKSTFSDKYIAGSGDGAINSFKKTIINIMSLLNSSADYEV